MSDQPFPWIRPEQAEAMTSRERGAYLRWLRKEMLAAALRHRQILTQRATRRFTAEIEAARAAEAKTGDWTELERQDAERMLAAHRIMIAFGLGRGDGTPDDDLRCAHAAVVRGSTNGYILSLDREYMRRKTARNRQARAAMAQARAS